MAASVSNTTESHILQAEIKNDPISRLFDYEIVANEDRPLKLYSAKADKQLEVLANRLVKEGGNFNYQLSFDQMPEKAELYIYKLTPLYYEAKLKIFPTNSNPYFYYKSIMLKQSNGLIGTGDLAYNQARLAGLNKKNAQPDRRQRSEFSFCPNQFSGEVDVEVHLPERRFSIPRQYFLETYVYLHSSAQDSVLDYTYTTQVERLEFICPLGRKTCETPPVTVSIPITYIKGKYYSIHVMWKEKVGRSRNNPPERALVSKRYDGNVLPNVYSVAIGDSDNKDKRYTFVLPWGKNCAPE